MNKLLTLSIILVALLSLSIFVSASGVIISYPENNGGYYDYNYEMNLEKGWNLIPFGENFPFYMSEGYIGEDLPIYQEILDYTQRPKSNRKAQDSPMFAYAFNSLTKDYMQIFPENKLDDGENFEEFYRLYHSSAMWVYVKEPNRVKYFAPNVPKLSDTKLVSGWNFLAISPEMQGKTLNQIKGNCDWTRVSAYSPTKREGVHWVDLLNDNNFVNEEILDSGAIGVGLAIKIENEFCNLSSSTGSVGDSSDSPPQLPGGSDSFSQTISIDSISDLDGGEAGSNFIGILKTSESDGSYPEDLEGFHIQVYMFSESPRETAFGGNAEYIGNGDWKIEGEYPSVVGNYEVEASLYCASSDDNAVCRQVYGEIQKEYKYGISIS